MQLSGVHLSVCPLRTPHAAAAGLLLCNCLVSICLSVCPLRTPHATAAGLLLCTWWAGDGSVAAAAARECGQ